MTLPDVVHIADVPGEIVPIPACAASFWATLRALARSSVAMLVACLLALGAVSTPAAADEAEASGRPGTVKVLLSSRSDACYDPGDTLAIKRLTRLEQQRVNDSGGIAGRKLQVEFLDDQRDNERAVGNVHSSLSDPDTIAVIGLSNAERAKAAFASLDHEIAATQI